MGAAERTRREISDLTANAASPPPTIAVSTNSNTKSAERLA